MPSRRSFLWRRSRQEVAMGRGIKLTEAQWDELDALRLTTPAAQGFPQGVVSPPSALKETLASIARQLGCTPFTVVRIRRLYRQGGAKALRPIKPPGRTSRATPEFLAQMKQAVQSNPLTSGEGFSTWAATRLAEHLAKASGIH